MNKMDFLLRKQGVDSAIPLDLANKMREIGLDTSRYVMDCSQRNWSLEHCCDQLINALSRVEMVDDYSMNEIKRFKRISREVQSLPRDIRLHLIEQLLIDLS